MASLGDQCCTFEAHELRSVGLLANGPYGDKALPWPRSRLALRKHLRLGVDRVSDEYGGGQLDVVPAEIADGFLADVAHAHSDDHRQRKTAIDQRSLELRLCGVLLVEMQGMGVHRQQREPRIVALGNGAAGTVFVDIADGEIVVIPAETFAVALWTDCLVTLHHSLRS